MEMLDAVLDYHRGWKVSAYTRLHIVRYFMQTWGIGVFTEGYAEMIGFTLGDLPQLREFLTVPDRDYERWVAKQHDGDLFLEARNRASGAINALQMGKLTEYQNIVHFVQQHSSAPRGRILSFLGLPFSTVGEANPEGQPMRFTVDYETVLERARAVALVSVPVIVDGEPKQHTVEGTGWLIAPALVLTCYHVLQRGSTNDSNLSRQIGSSLLTFDYTHTGKGVQYGVATLECADRTSDYALLRLEDRMEYPLSNRPFLQLERDAPLTPATALFVIQHPKGQPQQNSGGYFIRFVTDSIDNILHSAPTEQGTSGAPVLDQRTWNVRAMHKREDFESQLRVAVLIQSVLHDIKRQCPSVYDEILKAQVA